jgi:tRNA pseudouridine55 synthase
MTSGVVIVDKPARWTSHDVVAKIRKLAGTRRVGHAGTLDPMATGVLIVGVDKATRLLGYLALTEKEYTGTIRLGQTTDTDDADGALLGRVTAKDVSEADLHRAIGNLTGDIQQVPPGVSAIKVAGQRSYRLARAGAAPELAPRSVTVREFDVLGIHRAGDLVDVHVRVTCSTGTYIRALARDLGAALGVGGHLTALRRTRVGPYSVSQAHTLDRLAEQLELIPLADAAAAAFPTRSLTSDEARLVGHGGKLAVLGAGAGPVAAFGPDGSLVALLTEEDGQARSLAVFSPSSASTASTASTAGAAGGKDGPSGPGS